MDTRAPILKKASKRAKTAKPKKKPPTLSKLKRETDRLFSLYIRAKYPKVCYTCGATGKTLQCGHFVSRSYLATRWTEDNARQQCVGCNIWGRGKPLDFEEHLIEEIGAVKVADLKRLRHTLIKANRKFYEEKIGELSTKLLLVTNV